MSFVFPSQRRLQTAAEFKRVWQKAKRTYAQGITLISCDNNLDYPRLGLSLSKKHVRRAVDRNRLKRVARETFRIKQAELGGLDIVVVVYKGADQLPPPEQYQRFKILWNRLASHHKKSS